MKSISIKCGKLNCEFYNEESVSKCSKYTNRTDCNISIKQRGESKIHSQKTASLKYEPK